METENTKYSKNPYQAPQSDVAKVPTRQQYNGKIYNAFSIAIATLFGSVFAGGLLLYSNFDRFSQKRQATITIFLTIVATIGFLFGSLFVEYSASLFYLIVNFISAALILPLTSILQGNSIDAHESSGKPFYTVFRAAGVGILCLFGLGFMLTAAILLFVGFK